MKLRLTYKEYSILAGIAVAAIILFMIWLQPMRSEVSGNGGTETPQIIVPSVGSLVQKAQLLLQLSR